MKIFLAAIILAACFTGCNNNSSKKNADGDTSNHQKNTALNTLSDKEVGDGWTILFDGKTTKGWHTYGEAAVGEAWKITDGILYLDTSKKYDKDPSINVDMKIIGGGDIITDDEYENFHLKMEWKISPKGNSGIIFYVNEDTAKFKASYMTGPEMQVLDNEGHGDGKYFRHRAGDLYDLVNCSKETVKAPGEWNLAEIVANNGKLDLILNGTTVVSTTMWDDNWNRMIAKSKFKDWPGFGTFKKGRICLQDHDNEVSFRNIKIRKL